MCVNVYITRLLNQGADPSTAAPKSAAAGAPPPPPPPAIQPPTDVPAAKTTKDDATDRAALFAAINKGSAITTGKLQNVDPVYMYAVYKGLRKVTDDQKTHKKPCSQGIL